ncbi:MAG: thiamine pyrophosphate-binding protein [Actinomycetota bacterium]
MDAPEPAARIAGRLAAAGTTVGFGVPGGGPNLDVIGAFEAVGIRFVLAHGETAAAIMAATVGHLSRTPVPVVVTRGPGATSVVNGAAQATLDRQPLVVITDTVPSATADRVPHQRLDQGTLFGPITKGGARVGPDATDADLDRLIGLATAEPPGAVHVDYDGTYVGPLGGDTPTAAEVRRKSGASEPVAAAVVDTTAAEVPARIAGMMTDADRPVVVIGRAAAAADCSEEVLAAVERLGAPTLSTYQGVGVVPGDHPLNAGLFTNGDSERAILAEADLIVTVGLDMVEPIPAAWDHPAPVLALSPIPTVDPYLPIDLEITGPLTHTLTHVPDGDHRWSPQAATDHRKLVLDRLRDHPSGFAPTQLVETLVAQLPHNAITTVDAGAHFLAVMPFHPARRPGDLLISNGLATMGYAVPAAIGAALARPNRPVYAVTGDGGLGMVLAELETIARLQLPITIVVLNDSALSLIEIKQRDNHGGTTAVRYNPTDFAAAAGAMGVPGRTVDNADAFAAALAEPFDGPRLIDARIDPAQYTNLIAVTRGG